jgi:hypothetical protein
VAGGPVGGVGPPLSIVFEWEQDVEAYAAAGRAVEVPRLKCPSCGRPLVLKSWYPRWARDAREWRIWIRRGLCRVCGRSHGLLPSFLLERRLDVVEVIGEGLRRSVAGEGLPKIAVALGRPYSTVRDWRRRHRERAGELVGELAARVVELGGEVPKLSVEVERLALGLLAVARSAAARRLERVAGIWTFTTLVTGGRWLARTTSPP